MKKSWDFEFKIQDLIECGKTQKAFELYKKFAEQTDDADVMYRMANFYEQGLGTPRNYSAAIYWYKRSISGHTWWVASPYRLGIFYEKGLGVDVDIEEAILYYGYCVAVGIGLDFYDKAWAALERLSYSYDLAKLMMKNRGVVYIDGKRLLPHGITI